MALITATTTTADKLLASLKRHTPAKVRAYAGDDDFRDIAVPQRRRRWTQVIEAIEARAWSRVELLDKSGAVLGYVDNVEPARDLEEFDGARGKVRSEAEWIVQLVIKAQRDAVALARERDADASRAMVETLREVLITQRDLNELARARGDAQAELAQIQAAADNGGQLRELLEAAPSILQAIPMLRQLMSPDKPKNGA
jgi:hypothetical protein